MPAPSFPAGRILALLAIFAVAAGAARAAVPILTVTAPDRTLTLSAEEFAALPRTEVAAAEPHSKTEHRYAGVALRELLLRVGAPLGEKLRGPALRLGVLVQAADGYSVLYALAEFDEAFSDRTIVLADRMDGQPLRESAAPFQLILPGDKRGARWIRMVTTVTIVALPSP